jgi:hypothetical protein
MGDEGIGNFDCNGDQTSVGQRWGRWLRALELYMESQNITVPRRKRATLLHKAGLEVQDVFFSLPSSTSEVAETDLYKVCVEALTT